MQAFKQHFILMILSALLLSCSGCSEKTDVISLKVILSERQFKNLKGKYLYLFDNDKREYTDSELVKNQKVIFKIFPDSAFHPYLVSIRYNEVYENHSYRRPLGFYYPNKLTKNTVASFFYLDRGTTIFKSFDGNFTDTTGLSFVGSKQNDPMFNEVFLKYPGDNLLEQMSIIKQNISIIRKYPFSYFLLKQLFYYKEHFLDADLKKQLNEFDEPLKQSSLFLKFSGYFEISKKFDVAAPSSILLENRLGKYDIPISKSAKYNLVVFWASWCVPCREEIFELKKIYRLYVAKGLHISSISLDANKSEWKRAVEFEKMPWQQFIITNSSRNFFETNYNITSIPKLYLFDKENNLVFRFSGTKSNISGILDSAFAKK